MSRDHSGETVAILAGIGIGAALMYFLDPHRGNARRAEIIDETSRRLRAARYDSTVADEDTTRHVREVEEVDDQMR